MLQIAQYISYGLGLYALIGLLFGLYFITRGLRNAVSYTHLTLPTKA